MRKQIGLGGFALAAVLSQPAGAALQPGDVFLSIFFNSATSSSRSTLLIDTGISAQALVDNPALFNGFSVGPGGTINTTAIADWLSGKDLSLIRFNAGGTQNDFDEFSTFGFLITRENPLATTGLPTDGSGVITVITKMNTYTGGVPSSTWGDSLKTFVAPNSGTGSALRFNQPNTWQDNVGGTVGFDTSGLLDTDLEFNRISSNPNDEGLGAGVEAFIGNWRINSATGTATLTTVPVPGAVWLLGSALGALVLRRRGNV